MRQHKIILDTDPGIDDAYAIFYALAHPSIELLALTTVFGNVDAELAAQNALRLVELTGSAIPVAKGADAPLVYPRGDLPVDIHGVDGFGNTAPPAPQGHVTTQSAAELIVEAIHANPGEVTLVPVGPLTNIAAALTLDPQIATLCKEVVVMGGAAMVPGNITPAAEANIYNDPHAAEIVFGAAWPVTLVGLDATMKLVFSRAEVAALAHIATGAQADDRTAGPDVGVFLSKISPLYADFYQAHRGLDGIVPHDLVALFALTNPDWFRCERGTLTITLQGQERGATCFEPGALGDRAGAATKTRAGAPQSTPESSAQINPDINPEINIPGTLRAGDIAEQPRHRVMTDFDPTLSYAVFTDQLKSLADQ